MRFFRNYPYEVIIFFLYIVASFFIVWNHEPWLDEAQAWLIARDCNFSQLFEQMKYEGTPALWHLILMPFAKLELPYFSMQLIHWLFSVGMIFLLLFYSPFTFLMRTGITFSYIMFYEYTVKARCYNISILLLFALATLYPKRMQKPLLYALLIGLLCQTNLLCLPAAFGLAIIFTWEIFFHSEKYQDCSKYRYSFAIIFMAFAGLVAFFQIYPPKSATPYLQAVEFRIPLVKIWESIQQHLAKPVIMKHSILRYSQEIKYILEFCFNIFALWLLTITAIVIRRSSLVCFLFFSTIFLFILESLLAKFYTRHYGFFVIFPLIVLWIYLQTFSIEEKNYNKKLDTIAIKFLLYSFHILWILSIPFTLFYSYFDLRQNYSQSPDAAKFIKQNHLEQYEIVAYLPHSCSSILPYLSFDKRFWYPHNQKYGSFITWDADCFQYGTSLSDEEIISIIDKTFFAYISKQHQKVILILSETVLGTRSNPRLKLLYNNPLRTMSADERYSIYILVKP